MLPAPSLPRWGPLRNALLRSTRDHECASERASRRGAACGTIGRVGGSHRGALTPRHKLRGCGAVGSAAESVAAHLRTPQTCKGHAMRLRGPCVAGCEPGAHVWARKLRSSGLHLAVLTLIYHKGPPAARRRTERADLRHDARALNALCQLHRWVHASRDRSALGARWAVLPATRLSSRERTWKGGGWEASARTGARAMQAGVLIIYLKCAPAARGAHPSMLIKSASSCSSAQISRPAHRSNDSSDHQRLHHADCSVSVELAELTLHAHSAQAAWKWPAAPAPSRLPHFLALFLETLNSARDESEYR